VGADLPLTRGDPWLKLGPFRCYEQPGECLPHTSAGRGRKPVYYADFLTLGGQEFFNSVTEIRNDFGYEWAPNADVLASVERGVRQLKRAFDAMAMASLFTHETDFIFQISPERWAQIIAGVARGIEGYDPIQMTLDAGMRYLRATKTARLASARYTPESGMVTAVLEGQADVLTHFYLFTGEGNIIDSRLVEVPQFAGQVTVQEKIDRQAK
jgi:hypothetical protein